MLSAEPNRGESAVDCCERALLRGILQGEFLPGSRLPPERTLAEELGVNRVTLRGALSRLCAQHLVSARQGSGYLVHDYRRHAGLDVLPALLASTPERTAHFADIARDLLLVRRQLARATFERLCEHIEPRALQRIEEAIAQFASAVSAGADLSTLAEKDLAIASALVEATGSPVLSLCLNPVLAIVRQTPELRAAMYREPASNVEGYRALSAWLEALPSSAAGGVPVEAGVIDAVMGVLVERDEATVAHLRARKGRARRS